MTACKCEECESSITWEEIERQLDEYGEVICPECKSTDIDLNTGGRVWD